MKKEPKKSVARMPNHGEGGGGKRGTDGNFIRETKKTKIIAGVGSFGGQGV